jgi:cell division protein FtsB
MGKVEKLGFYLTLLLMVLFLVFIFFSRQGIKDYRQLKIKKTSVLSQIDITRQENKLIENQIVRLKQDSEYIKHLAKHEHGMALPDELIFKLEKNIQGARP